MEIDIENNGFGIAMTMIGIVALIIIYTEATIKGVMIFGIIVAIAITIYKYAIRQGAIGDMKHIQTRIKNWKLKKRIRNPKLKERKAGEKKREKWNIHW